VTERLRAREIDDDEGRRLVRIIRRGSGSVVTWRRAQMVLLSAPGMDVPAIAKVAFTSENRVRDVTGNLNADGFGSLYPKYKGGHPPKFTLGQRREIKKIAKARPAEYDLPFSTWSLAKLAEFLVAEGVVDDISHEGLRILLRQEGVSFQRLKTWKGSTDPRYAAKKTRIEQLDAIADPRRPGATAIRRLCSALTNSDRSTCSRGPAGNGPRSAARTRNPAGRRGGGYAQLTPAPPGSGTCSPPTNWAKTSSTGTSSRARPRARFLEFCRYLRSLDPPHVRIAIICDNFSPHLTTAKDARIGTWAAANNVEIASTPTNSSWLNRVEAQFTALRYFALDGTDHASHKEQASMIRRYIIWRNNHAYDERLRRIVAKANVA
jgi:transposase